MQDLSRRDIRYLCFRLRTEHEGGAEATGLPEGFKEHFESQKEFRGWKRFGATWDVGEDDPLIAVYRKYTIHEEWNATLRRVVKELPSEDL